ncbi:MAG: three-Cys-motif partner protein TcmP [Dehalococcoidia bacterium]|nr:three-Cys-motif partner protein TcmP [Dehalococcoidia bacterium]
MTGTTESTSGGFGGQWTIEKLDILERYLDAYTTALKNQPFKLVYIDAFAGTGGISIRSADDDAQSFIDGSAKLAIEIDAKPFDKLIFVEKDTRRYNRLATLRSENPNRDITTINSDANSFLSSLQEDWRIWRGVLFLDPFATEVEWGTIEKIANLNALDTWILFPISAITRMLPRSKNPDDISDAWANRLTRIFGDESWRGLYRASPQQSLFGDESYQRDPGTEGISSIYRVKLRSLFGTRVMETSRTLMNSKNSPLFEFVFCAGHPSGAAIAKRIAKHILDAMG